MIVTTGFGYYVKDEVNVLKYVLPLGEHPLAAGYTQVEVADQAALDLIEVTPEE
jgi:hypothetical protein